jgi:hypothetical protein
MHKAAYRIRLVRLRNNRDRVHDAFIDFYYDRTVMKSEKYDEGTGYSIA